MEIKCLVCSGSKWVAMYRDPLADSNYVRLSMYPKVCPGCNGTGKQQIES